MLRSLDIRDIVLIERLSLDLSAGLNALTGETGAGKSILLDALVQPSRSSGRAVSATRTRRASARASS